MVILFFYEVWYTVDWFDITCSIRIYNDETKNIEKYDGNVSYREKVRIANERISIIKRYAYILSSIYNIHAWLVSLNILSFNCFSFSVCKRIIAVICCFACPYLCSAIWIPQFPLIIAKMPRLCLFVKEQKSLVQNLQVYRTSL